MPRALTTQSSPEAPGGTSRFLGAFNSGTPELLGWALELLWAELTGCRVYWLFKFRAHPSRAEHQGVSRRVRGIPFNEILGRIGFV